MDIDFSKITVQDVIDAGASLKEALRSKAKELAVAFNEKDSPEQSDIVALAQAQAQIAGDINYLTGAEEELKQFLLRAFADK